MLLGGKFGPAPLVAGIGAGAFLGIGSLLVMSYDMVWRESPNYKRPLRDALMLPVFAFIAGLCMNLVNGRAQWSYDYRLFAFDTTLWTSPERTVAHLFKAVPWLATASSIAYTSLLIFPPLYHGWGLYRSAPRRMHLMNAFVAAGVCGFVLYQVCPAIGPLYCFKHQFPSRLPLLAGSARLEVFLSPDVHNAMPSMHITWALLVWWSSWGLGRLAVWVASIFVALTGLAMIGFGEHYLVDIVVALPLVLLVHGICARRHVWTFSGTAMALSWLLFFRSGVSVLVPPFVNWMLIGVTLACSTWPLWRRRRELVHEKKTVPIDSSPAKRMSATSLSDEVNSPEASWEPAERSA
jgi:hypothetical protein